jgi:universal stress protein E
LRNFKTCGILLKKNEAPLKVVEVVEEFLPEIRMLFKSIRQKDLMEYAVSERQQALDQWVEPIRKEGIQVTTKVLVGSPSLAVIREVLKAKHDLVVKAAQGNGGFKELFFGATSMHLLRNCPCPVWAVKPMKHARLERILAAVDPLPVDDEHLALNTKILELGLYLAEAEGGELHVVHSWTLPRENLIRNRVGLSAREVGRMVQETERVHLQQFHEVVKKQIQQIPDKQIHFSKGDAGKIIPEVVRTHQIDLLVMGTVGRRGMSGLFIGNTAEKVLQKVDCSVLGIKPEGFVSPVALEATQTRFNP